MQHNHHHPSGVALITGSASGIGRAVAHAFVRDGCTRLILADIDVTGLATVSQELKDLNHAVRTCPIVCDTSIEADIQRMVDEGVKTFGSINYAVNNAEVSNKPRAPIHELHVSAFDRVQNINLRGIWMCERAEVRQMLQQEPDLLVRPGVVQRGSIINISSIFSRTAHFTASAYCATKAGVLSPAPTRVPMDEKGSELIPSAQGGFGLRVLVEYGIQQGTYDESIVKGIPMERWGSAEDIAAAVAFLASTGASFITGEDITVDGGSVIKSVS